MEKLKGNEVVMLEALQRLSVEQGHPIKISTKNIPVMFSKKLIVTQERLFNPSKNAKHEALKRLQRKGYVRLDGGKQNYSITIIT
jgi:hypothetical protein